MVVADGFLGQAALDFRRAGTVAVHPFAHVGHDLDLDLGVAVVPVWVEQAFQDFVGDTGGVDGWVVPSGRNERNGVHLNSGQSSDKHMEGWNCGTYDDDLGQVASWFVENGVEVVLTESEPSVSCLRSEFTTRRTSRTSEWDQSKWGH